MLLGGDEIGRSQGGNNNTYCQDSEIGWIDWGARDEEAEALLAFTRRLIALRHDHVVFRRSRFFSGTDDPRHRHQGRDLAAPERGRDEG